MTIAPTQKTALIRVAQRLVADGMARALRPRVVWQGLDETDEAYSKRLSGLRKKVADGQTLVAVSASEFDARPGVQCVSMPAKHFGLLHPSVAIRYRLATGGRGSGKSHSTATALVLRSLEERLRVLCAREFQNSIRESVHHLIGDRIDQLGLSSFFDVQERGITCTLTGAEFLFEGLHANVTRIKSLEGIDVVWIEQAETISARSLEVLVPTVRNAGSEIWMTVNPDDPHAPVESYRDRADVRHAHTTFEDNPWFPDVLKAEMEWLRGVDDDAYRHVWLGQCRTASDAQVFRGKYVIEEFDVRSGWAGPYFGVDWGFSQDPTTMVRCWVADRTLYVDWEAYGVGVDIDKTPGLFDQVPDARRHTIRADSARPETVSYLQRHGYPHVHSVDKWPGSVEDGIAHLRQYDRIVIHPRCPRLADEMRLYSYKVDRLSGDVMPDLIDRHNHCIDALRYALGPLIRRQGPEALIEFYRLSASKAPRPVANTNGAVVSPLGGVAQ